MQAEKERERRGARRKPKLLTEMELIHKDTINEFLTKLREDSCCVTFHRVESYR